MTSRIDGRIEVLRELLDGSYVQIISGVSFDGVLKAHLEKLLEEAVMEKAKQEKKISFKGVF